MSDRSLRSFLNRIDIRPWWGWILVSALLVLGIYSWNEAAKADQSLQARYEPTAQAHGSTISPQPILAGGDRVLDLSGDMAQAIVLPHGTALSEALRQLRSGRGASIGNGETLSSVSESIGSTSLYVWFAYKTISQDPVLLRYRSLSQLLTAVWVSDDHGNSFELVDIAGHDAPNYQAALPEHADTLPLRTSISLPPSLGQPRYVLVRVDSIFPYWSNLSLNASYVFEHQRSERNYLDGVVLGSLLVAIAFALYGLYYRQTSDYLAFLVATAAMCLWYLALGEHFVGTHTVFFRRLTFAGPVYVYFLLHAVGLQRLLYPKDWLRTRHWWHWRSIPLGVAAGYSGLGLACAIAYATLGLHTPGAGFINALNEWLFAVAPALLLLAVLAAPDKRVPAYGLLLAVELVGALGSGLQFVHFNSQLLESRIAEVLIRYPLPIEALLWAAALSSRFNYLEMIAKRRVKSALRKEARKVKAAMQTTLESREQALAALDNSYRALDQVRSSILGIIDAHSHAAGNLLMRLGGHLARIGRGEVKEQPQHISAASRVLDELATAIESTERAVGEAQTSQHALAPASSLLRWQSDAMMERLSQRGVTLQLHIERDCEMLLVDGYHFMEVIRELLSNINRYAVNDSVATLALRCNATQINVCSENAAVLRPDDQGLRMGLPVSPATSNFSGEQSSGRGLATLGTLLSGIGGSIKYDTHPPSQVIVTAVLPRRR